MRSSVRLVLLLIAVVAAAAAPVQIAHAAAIQADAASVAGRWRMTIEFDHEARPAGLQIAVSGGKVTGSFAASFAGGEVPIAGEFRGGTLTFQASTTGGPHPGMSLDFTATLKDNATLAGTMSAPFGDFSWTAERLR
jgi:hypothetical protein